MLAENAGLLISLLQVVVYLRKRIFKSAFFCLYVKFKSVLTGLIVKIEGKKRVIA